MRKLSGSSFSLSLILFASSFFFVFVGVNPAAWRLRRRRCAAVVLLAGVSAIVMGLRSPSVSGLGLEDRQRLTCTGEKVVTTRVGRGERGNCWQPDGSHRQSHGDRNRNRNLPPAILHSELGVLHPCRHRIGLDLRPHLRETNVWRFQSSQVGCRSTLVFKHLLNRVNLHPECRLLTTWSQRLRLNRIPASPRCMLGRLGRILPLGAQSCCKCSASCSTS